MLMWEKRAPELLGASCSQKPGQEKALAQEVEMGEPEAGKSLGPKAELLEKGVSFQRQAMASAGPSRTQPHGHSPFILSSLESKPVLTCVLTERKQGHLEISPKNTQGLFEFLFFSLWKPF